jgi:F-type H+-transporting ATPase subunit delta
MKISKQSRREAKQLFKSCLVNGLLDDNRARQATDEVLALKPRGYIGILSQFERLVKLDIERRTAKVESAFPLPSDIQSKVQAGLVKHYGQGVAVSFTQNPALIGGLRIKVGSDVYDGSVQARLNALQESFSG